MPSKILLRPLTDESIGTCDWGGCDGEAVAERQYRDQWLSVCNRHAGRNPNWTTVSE